MGFDDLMQDCLEYFYICKDKYPHVNDARWFMSLYKRCVCNHFYDLAVERTEAKEYTAYVSHRDEAQGFDDCLHDILIDKAPMDIRAVLIALVEDGADYINLAQGKFRTRRTKKRETTNEYLCRLAGLTPSKHN